MAASPVIAVLTHRDDEHLQYVEKHLRGTQLLVVDTRDMVTGTELSFSFDGNGRSETWFGDVDLSNIRSVWYRKPAPFTGEDVPVKSDFTDYSVSSLQSLSDMLPPAMSDAFWVSDPTALKRASSKPLQLHLAHQLGFNIPPTLMTSDSDRAKRFVSEMQSRRYIPPTLTTSDPDRAERFVSEMNSRGMPCVVKRLARVFPQVDGVPYPFFTSLVGPDQDFSGLNVGPAIFQVALQAAFHLRVMVVGYETFTSRIDYVPADPDSPVMDWRLGHFSGELSYSPYNDLPASVRLACVKLVRQLGLQSGTSDLIVDKDGTIWFLELNPNGQWAFVDDDTTFKIGQALARLLEAPYLEGR